MKRSTLERLEAARKQVHAAQEKHWALVARTFKFGDEVGISHGLETRWATVTERTVGGETYCTGADKVLVVGRTGREYWVYASSIVAHVQKKPSP